jgi:hypothetical protein
MLEERMPSGALRVRATTKSIVRAIRVLVGVTGTVTAWAKETAGPDAIGTEADQCQDRGGQGWKPESDSHGEALLGEKVKTSCGNSSLSFLP